MRGGWAVMHMNNEAVGVRYDLAVVNVYLNSKMARLLVTRHSVILMSPTSPEFTAYSGMVG